LFVEHASADQVTALADALSDTAAAYDGGHADEILRAKNRFYDRLFEGAGSETLSSMLVMLHARIWRWRALGLGHARRSPSRSRESLRALRSMLARAR